MPDQYAQHVLEKCPVGYWRFEENSGPVAHDSAPHGHPGSYKGEVRFAQPGAIRSSDGRAIVLNGKDAFVEIASDPVFSQPKSGMGLTVEAWLRPDLLRFHGETDQPYVHWLGKGETGRFEWGFRFYSQCSDRPNRISAYIWNPTVENGEKNEGAGAYFEDPIEPHVWIHVVACYDPGDASNSQAGVSIFKNGVRRGSPSTSPGALYASYNIYPVPGYAPLRLGTRDTKSFLTGGLDEVAIYPRVLTCEEILDNYNAASR
ncbi:MAG TPA: LamG domain-containing protein [Acetobacteraceae bacterium]|nr:LamG domain-containing protein [Acetobacteraceae bacterium]